MIQMKRKEILSFLKENQADFFKKIGEYDPIQKGERTCFICGEVINFDNISMVIPRDNAGRFDYICNDNQCIKEVKR